MELEREGRQMCDGVGETVEPNETRRTKERTDIQPPRVSTNTCRNLEFLHHIVQIHLSNHLCANICHTCLHRHAYCYDMTEL